MKTKILIFILVLFLISMVSASVTCNPNFITKVYTQGETVYSSIQCSNSDVNNSVTLSTTGDYFTLDQTVIGKAPSQKTFTITFENAPVGTHSGSIEFSDGSSPVPVIQIVNEPTPTSLISFPTSKIMNVQQGETYNKKITMIMPSTYPNPINIQSIEFSEENNIVSFGDIETGILNPGEVKDIPIRINAKDAQVGQYPPISVQVRFDDNGEIVTLSSVLHIIVTASLNPLTNMTFSNPPACSLSASVMNINNTYSFTCSNVQKNLEISPIFNEYFQGENVQLNGDIYVYEFHPLKYGNTEFISTFTYLGAPLFQPFRQEVKILSSGSVVPGTNLKFLFTPKLENLLPNQEVIIQLVDNKSGNLVDNPKLYINAIQIFPLNQSQKSFPYKFELDKNYEIRGEAEGYDNIVQIVNISSQFIEFTIFPEKDFYNVGDVINVTSKINGTSFLINDAVMNNPQSYYLSLPGNFTIKAVHEDYLTSNKTITVKSLVTLTACSPKRGEWKKGKVLCELSKNVSWSVYKDNELIKSGEGGRLEFKITDLGYYEIKSNDISIYGERIEKKSAWWKPWTWNIFTTDSIKKNWYYWLGGFLILGTIGYFYFRKTKETEGPMFAPQGGVE